MSLGYAIDTEKTRRTSTVMRHANGDRLIIAKKPDDVYVYIAVRNGTEAESGTIVDLLKHDRRENLGEIRRELRRWLGIATPPLPELTSVQKDRMKIAFRYNAMSFASRHPYLEDERKIPVSTLQHWRFQSRVKVDRYQNAVFPHYDVEGLCGFEMRGHDFKGFSKGGAKGLWLSKQIPEDTALIVCESGIDALSYSTLFPNGFARYASICGKPNAEQPELLKRQIARMPKGSDVVAAFDDDEAGQRYEDVMLRAFKAAGNEVNFYVERPKRAKDWNELLSQRPLRMRP